MITENFVGDRTLKFKCHTRMTTIRYFDLNLDLTTTPKHRWFLVCCFIFFLLQNIHIMMDHGLSDV